MKEWREGTRGEGTKLNGRARTFRIKLDGLDLDGELDLDALRLGARARLLGDLAEGGGRHMVALADQVEHVPHVLRCRGRQGWKEGWNRRLAWPRDM